MPPLDLRVFVYRGGSTDVLQSTIGDGAGWVVVNASSDVFLHEHLPVTAVLRRIKTYVTIELRRDLMRQGTELATSWFRRLPQEAYTFDGLELPDLVSARSHFIAVLDAVCLADRVVDVEGPSRIVLEDDGSFVADVFKMVGAARGVVVDVINRPSRARQPQSQSRVSFAKLAGARAYRYALAAASLLQPAKRAASKILFPDYFRFHPLISDLAARPEFEVFVLPNSRKPLRALLEARHGFRHAILGAYLTARQAWSLRRYERLLQRGVRRWLEAFNERETYRGYPVMPACHPWLETQIVDEFPALAFFAAASKALLSRERIGQVVVNQDLSGYPRVLCLAARQLGIRTICYQHGLSVNMAPGVEHISDVIAAWGPQEVENYRRHGRHRCADKMHVLGDTYLQHLKSNAVDRRAIAARLGLDADRPVALVTCERFVNYYSAAESVNTPNERMVRILDAAVALDLQVLLRFKQDFTYEEFGDGAETKRAIAARYDSRRVVIDPGGNIYDRLALADVVVVTNSTVGLEAMLFGKPVLAVEEADTTDSAEYVGWGAAMRVTTVEEIRAGFERALHDPTLREQLAERQRSFIEFTFANLHDADPLERVRNFLRSPAPAYS